MVFADFPFNVIPSTRENFDAFDLPKGLETNRPVAAERLMAWLLFMKATYQICMNMCIYSRDLFVLFLASFWRLHEQWFCVTAIL